MNGLHSLDNRKVQSMLLFMRNKISSPGDKVFTAGADPATSTPGMSKRFM